VVAGHSGSCLAARRVALDSPGRVAGLLLEASPTTLHRDEKLTRFVETVVAELSDPIDRSVARSFVIDTSSVALAADFVDRLVDDLVKVPVRVWREMFASLLRYDDTPELSQLTHPVMLIWGDQDQLVPRSMQEELVRALPHAELTVYADVGHTPRWERPERFANDVATFCARTVR
jgi:pimeloyl-ACP methyl ester carboxylesterase